jgi:DNA-directed RNA polymerase beta subunit
MRSSGVKSLYTHQPKGGRSQRGGQKIGEMEKDSFVAHGASGVIVERLMKVSDEFKLVICQNCGVIINNKNCTLCDNSQPGILTIPYVFKLLIHLMNGVGLDIRLRTKEKEITNE